MTQLLMPGQETYMNIRRKPSADGQPGELLFVVLVSMFTTHVSLLFANHDILDKALPAAEARAYLQYLMDEAAAGTELWLLKERAGRWTTAMAVVDQAEQDMIDGIAANLKPAPQHHTEQEREDCQRIVADRQGWNRYRQAATRTGKPTSDPMDRILNSATGGYIPRGGNVSSTQLIALKKRGKVVLDWGWQGKTRVLNGAWVAGYKTKEKAA